MTSDHAGNLAASAEKERFIQEMMHQVGILQKRFQAEGEDEERRWMMARTDDPKVHQFLRDASILMLHVMDAIGERQPVNGIAISKQFGIPRGSVSKITRKLVEQQVVRSELLPDNKKEVWFYLTPLGSQVYDLHKQLHRHIERNVKTFLGRYEVEQMRFLVQCMKDTSATSWVQDETSAEPHEAVPERLALSGVGPASQETSLIGEVLDMLQRLDARNLKKAKDLIQVAFFD